MAGSDRKSRYAVRARVFVSVPEPQLGQSFQVARLPAEALDAAAAYLEGAGQVAPGLRGRMERLGDRLAVHHGRVRTVVRAFASEDGAGSRVEVSRRGQAPLEDTRRWLVLLGLGGFLIAWALTVYNERAAEALSPLVTMSVFFLAVVAAISVLFVADRSLERRSVSLMRSLEDAMKGDPVAVLRREVDALERSSALANGLLFYCAALLAEFLVFVIVLSDGVRDGINEAAALDSMRFGFLIPVLPAVAFALVWFVLANRVHGRRLAEMRSRSLPAVAS